MNKSYSKILGLLLLALSCIMPASVMAETCFRAGPYLQELGTNGVTVVFENTKPTFAWVELRLKGTLAATKYYQEVKGQHQVYNTISAPSVPLPVQNFAVRMDGLKENSEYEYRVCSQQILEMQSYSIKLGTQYESEWQTFRTLDSKATEHHLVVLSDLHNRPSSLINFLNATDYSTAEHIIYAGDMMNNMQVGTPPSSALKQEEPYSSFINASVDVFARNKDFCMLRGDHETKGDAADFFDRYFPHQSGRLYNAYRWGDLEVVFLDGGEAAEDGNLTSRINNLALYRPYREEEARWFQKLIQTEEFRTAKYRIVVSHLPIPYGNDADGDSENAGTRHFSQLMLPLLNQAGIDLLVCGHLHPDTYTMLPKGTKDNDFPCLIQGYNSAVRIDIVGGALKLKVVDENGRVLN